MRIKFKKLHEDAVAPRQSREGDAAWDLVAVTKTVREKYVEYGTGISIVVPEDHVALIFPRSSISNYDLTLANSVGVIDPNYRGEIMFRFKPTVPIFDKRLMEAEHTSESLATIIRTYEVGDKIGQLIIIPRLFLDFEEAEELNKTNRGADGFGSSGK